MAHSIAHEVELEETKCNELSHDPVLRAPSRLERCSILHFLVVIARRRDVGQQLVRIWAICAEPRQLVCRSSAVALRAQGSNSKSIMAARQVRWLNGAPDPYGLGKRLGSGSHHLTASWTSCSWQRWRLALPASQFV